MLLDRSKPLNQSADQLLNHISLGIAKEPAFDSTLSPFKEIVMAVPTGLLYPHELTVFDNLSTVKFQEGWEGQPIAVAGLYDDSLYDQLSAGMYLATQHLAGSLMIIDGQTRWTKLRFEGIPTALVQLFPLKHPSLFIDTWKGNGYRRHTIEEVRLAARTRCQLPEKATRFKVLVNGGNAGEESDYRRIMHIQQHFRIAREHLDYYIPQYWDMSLGI